MNPENNNPNNNQENNPNTQPQAPQPQQAMPAVQQVSSQPAPQPVQTAPQQVQQPMNPAPVSQMPQPGNSTNTGKIVAIVVAVFGLLAIAGGLLWFFLMYWPQMQAKNAANSFVSITTEGNYEDALALTDSSEDQKEAATSLIKSLDDQLGDNSYSISKYEKVDGTYKITYRLKDDDNKWFRIELNSDLNVTGIFIGIGDVPEVTEDSTPTESQPVADTTTQNITACLPAAAIQEFWRYQYGWQFYFKADSNVLEDYNEANSAIESVALQSVKEMVEFYEKNKEYQFTFVINVGLYQSTDPVLAQKRAGVVAYNMYANGIPYERMRLGEVISGGDPSRPDLAGGSRNATVEINSECDALNQQQNLDVEGSKQRQQVGA